MKRGLLWFFVIAFIVGLGFYLPRKMLSYRYAEGYGLRATSDLSEQLTLTQEIDLIDRLAMLMDPNVRAVGLEVTEEQAKQAYEILLAELDKLRRCGYQTVPSYLEEFNTCEFVNEIVFVDRMHVMRVYEIHSATAYAVIDQQSHKILKIGSSVAPWDRANDALKSTDGKEPLIVLTLQAFADYYGLEFQDAKTWEEIVLNEDISTLRAGLMLDDDGDSVKFGLIVDDFNGFCYIGAVQSDDNMPTEEPQWESG